MNDVHAAARRAMCELQLAPRGIDDARVLACMAAVPRHAFVPPTLAARAHDDHALPIGRGQTISQPFIVAYMTQALRLEPGARVLEIGTGTGYQTAILALLAGAVYSVERDPALLAAARTRLARLGFGGSGLAFREGDGSLGWPEEAPFDAILCAAGAPAVPPALVAQLLAPGGRLVMPVGDKGEQRLVRATQCDGKVEVAKLIRCAFVPLVGAQGWTDLA